MLVEPLRQRQHHSRELQEIRQHGRRQDVPDVPQPRPYLLELLKRRLRERRLLRRRARRPGNRLLEHHEVALLQRQPGRTTHAAHPEAGIENRSEVRRFVVRFHPNIFIVFGNIFSNETGKLPANVLVANQVQSRHLLLMLIIITILHIFISLMDHNLANLSDFII